MTKDDETDDPQLKSLRAVWLALPDEEPPTRGLDALMAAARAKAEELAAPPWWKRLLHGLTRPPVLALATVMVLIGGAVLFSKHRTADEAMPTVKSNSAPAPTSEGAAGPGATTAPPPADERTRAPSVLQEQQKTPPPIETPKVPVENTPQPPRHVSPRSPELAKPKVEAATKGAGQAVGGAAPGFEPTTNETKADTAPAQGGEDYKETTQDPTKKDSAATRAPGRVMVDQLLVQCRSAATRGDCEAARQIARRIASQDATYYREHVATDAAIQKCITP